MKIRVLSDLHLEGRHFTYKHRGEDVVVFAGDVCSRTPIGIDRRNRLFTDIKVPVIYIPGNHEFYHGYGTRDEIVALIRAEVGLFKHVVFLDDSCAAINGVQFIGSTLWSDFLLPHPTITREHLMAALPMAINDFAFLENHLGNPLTAEDMAKWAKSAKSYLKAALAVQKGPTVVVTHFMPDLMSISERYQGSPMNAYFCCPVGELIKEPAKLWIHGHTHDACRYELNGVPVVCNPRGYAGENSGYDADLVVEI